MDDLFGNNKKEEVKLEKCSIYDIYNDIQFKMSKLFIDTRNENEYNKQHIRSAVNIPLNSFDLFRFDSNLLESKITQFIARKLYTISKVIWYGNEKYNPDNARQQLFYQRATDMILFKIRQQNKKKVNLNELNNRDETPDGHVPKMYILNGKYLDFQSKYPFLCDNKRCSASDDVNSAKNQLLIDFLSIYMNRKLSVKDEFKVYPSQVIDDRYFLGNAAHSSDKKILQNLQITHIINCTQTLNNEFSKKDESKNDGNEYVPQYIRVPVNDIPDQKIETYFIDAIRFIENTFNEDTNNKILCV